MDKVCKTCLVKKDISMFWKRKVLKNGNISFDAHCISCRKKKRKEFYDNNLEYCRAKQRERDKRRDPAKKKFFQKRWQENNKEYRLSYQRAYRIKNHENTLLWAKNYRNNLDDSYIRDLLVGKSELLSAKDIPQSLVEIKRAELRIKRQIKEMTI